MDSHMVDVEVDEFLKFELLSGSLDNKIEKIRR